MIHNKITFIKGDLKVWNFNLACVYAHLKTAKSEVASDVRDGTLTRIKYPLPSSFFFFRKSIMFDIRIVSARFSAINKCTFVSSDVHDYQFLIVIKSCVSNWFWWQTKGLDVNLNISNT